ncbi:MAG: hypothetical protein CMJ49_02935 [Planctomycetaceae bacterium]|nr:hypothetical protein [Planctomycetaceae bacterium]
MPAQQIVWMMTCLGLDRLAGCGLVGDLCALVTCANNTDAVKMGKLGPVRIDEAARTRRSSAKKVLRWGAAAMLPLLCGGGPCPEAIWGIPAERKPNRFGGRQSAGSMAPIGLGRFLARSELGNAGSALHLPGADAKGKAA